MQGRRLPAAREGGGEVSKQERIVALLRVEYHRASEAYRKAHAEHAGAIAAANTWDQHNRDDGVGGVSRNPYNVQTASENDERARVYAAQMREAYEFAVDTFIPK